jgi:hypothetical protein
VPVNVYTETPNWFMEHMRKEASGRWCDLSQRNAVESGPQPEAGPSSVPQTEDVTMESQATELLQSLSDMSTDTVVALFACTFLTEIVSIPFSRIHSMPSAER